MDIKRIFFVFNILAVLTLLMQGGISPIGTAASPVSMTGTFLVLWGDGTAASSETRIAYFLSVGKDSTFRLVISNDLLSTVGGPVNLNRRQVVVQGAWQVVGRSLVIQELALADGEHAGTQGIYGPQPWVSILCKFLDVPGEPNDLSYFQAMYSSIYPGLDHFWRQNSYDLANLEGSGAFGWYVLPYPRAHYLPGGNLDWTAAAQDCTHVADPYVDFTPYVGINLMFNDNLDCCAWGGSWYTCLDGICQSWRMTWEPPWGYQNIGVIAHETGHGFGLPHSLGNCQAGYDNRWDVLSDVWSNGSDPIWGTMGQHTISYHKELVEWITPDEYFTSSTGSLETITLEKLALPQSDNYLGARILINDQANYFYTLEVRQPTDVLIDYDKWLPGFAVIIHNVETNRPEPAIVVDQDGNCDTGDAGAMYTVGEKFTDLENGISVSIDSATSTGYIVTINNRFSSLAGVEIDGPTSGMAFVSIPFTATVTPVNATLPVTYTWEATGLPPTQHISGISDTIDLAWDDVGTKAITVTADNDGSRVVGTFSINIDSLIPIVSLSGPAGGSVGAATVFTATCVPTDVVQPITYTWQATGQPLITHTAGLSDVLTYTWDLPGTQFITVTAENLDGWTLDTLSLPIRIAPVSLEISGPAAVGLNEAVEFTAAVAPITTTLPITYSWSVDGQLTFTDTAGIFDVIELSWTQPGMHQISVTAANLAGSVLDTWPINVYIKVFLPLSLRD